MIKIDWIDVVVTPLVGALVGFGVWYFQSRLEALKRAQERLHDDRRKVYAEVLEPFILAFAGVKNPKENQRALAHMLSTDYKRTAFNFSLIGADDVVRSFNDLMQYVFSLGTEQATEPDSRKLMGLWGAFLLQIRRNVGNPDTKLTPADMLRSQITDIDKLMGKGSA